MDQDILICQGQRRAPCTKLVGRRLGIREWLSFFFKGTMTLPEFYPEHDLLIKIIKLKNTLSTNCGV